MDRRFAIAVIFSAGVIGCGKKPSDEAGAPLTGAITIKLRDRAAGDKFAVTESGKGSRKVTEDFGDGMPKSHDSAGEHNYAFTEELLEVPKPGELATKARRTYSVAELTDNGRKDAAAFQGKSVLVQPDKDGYEFRIEPGGELVFGPHAQHIARQYNPLARTIKATALLPERPVSVGEPWELNKDVVAKVFLPGGAKLDPARSTATGKLGSTNINGGREFGELVYLLNLSLLDDGPLETRLRIVPGSTLKMTITVVQCLDGTSSDADILVVASEATILRADARPAEPNAPKLPNEVRIHSDFTERITTKWLK